MSTETSSASLTTTAVMTLPRERCSVLHHLQEHKFEVVLFLEEVAGSWSEAEDMTEQ